MERIQKIMAQAGIASRRKCEELIKKGLVKVNGKVITIGDKAGIKDRIEVNGKLIKKEKMIYILLNKPKNVLCSVGDKFERKTVIDIIRCKEKVFPVGRLDFNSEGLLILTNDGDFANRVIHPRYNIKKRYLVVLDKALDKTAIGKIKNGVKIEGRRVNVFDLIEEEEHVELSIHEGRKHIIKKIFDSLGYKVVSLRRIAIGRLRLNLKAGEYKFTSKGWLESSIF
jgi:23S rRNA pseudouridine2605 synthase